MILTTVEGVSGEVMAKGFDVAVIRDEECGGYARVMRVGDAWRYVRTFASLADANDAEVE